MIVKVHDNGFGEIYNSTWFGETVTVQDEQGVANFFNHFFVCFQFPQHPTYFLNMEKVELQITEKDAQKLRRIIGLKTKVSATATVRSLINVLVKDPHQLEIMQYEKK